MGSSNVVEMQCLGYSVGKTECLSGFLDCRVPKENVNAFFNGKIRGQQYLFSSSAPPESILKLGQLGLFTAKVLSFSGNYVLVPRSKSSAVGFHQTKASLAGAPTVKLALTS